MTNLSYNLIPPRENEFLFISEDDPKLQQVAKKVLHLLEEPEYGAEVEETAVAQASTSDPRELIAALYSELRPQLYRYLRGTLNIDADQTKEIIQEAFLRLTAALLDGELIANPHGWVVRVARNIAIDQYRKQARLIPENDDLERTSFVNRIDPSLNQEERLLAEEQIRCLNEALRRLSPHHRDCFLMRLRGFRYKAIGEAMNIGERRAIEIVKLVVGRLAVVCG